MELEAQEGEASHVGLVIQVHLLFGLEVHVAERLWPLLPRRLESFMQRQVVGVPLAETGLLLDLFWRLRKLLRRDLVGTKAVDIGLVVDRLQ